MKMTACPQCGTPFRLSLPESELYVCQKCQAYLAPAENKVLKPGDKIARTGYSGIKLGQDVVLGGHTLKTIGRLAYRGEDDEDTWVWEELLLTDGKDEYWLEYEPELAQYTLYVEAVPGSEKYSGSGIVDDNESGTLLFAQGEIPWKASVGETYSYTTYRLPSGFLYAVERDVDGEEHFKGKIVTGAEIAKAFGIPEPKAVKSALMSDVGVGTMFRSGFLVLFVVALAATQIFERPVMSTSVKICPAGTGLPECVEAGDLIGPFALAATFPAHAVEIGTTASAAKAEVRLTLVDQAEATAEQLQSVHQSASTSSATVDSYIGRADFRLSHGGKYYLEIKSVSATAPFQADIKIQELPFGPYVSWISGGFGAVMDNLDDSE